MGRDLAAWYRAQRGLSACTLLLCLQSSLCPPWLRGRGGAESRCQGGTRLGMCLVSDSVQGVSGTWGCCREHPCPHRSILIASEADL